MGQFPIRLGTNQFVAQGQEPEDLAEAYVQGHRGGGAYGEGSELAVRRMDRVLARNLAYAHLATERQLLQLSPRTAGPLDALPDWEDVLGMVDGVPRGVMERQAMAAQAFGYVGGHRAPGEGTARGADVVAELEAIVGKGQVAYRYNTVAALLAGGYDQSGVFVVAFEVPPAAIASARAHAALMRIVDRIKPAHVGVAVTRTVALGFRVDDPLSLTNRDVVRI